MEGGYTGRLLVIDLSSEQVSIESYPDNVAREYLGGFGANNRLFTQFSRPGTGPFSPDNPLVLGAGPLVGTNVPGAARVMANSRLPLTGAIASAGGSMGLGANMKWAGWDHMAILGRATRPTVLRVEDDAVEFISANGLWGKGTLETTRLLWSAHPQHSVMSIGPAGEGMVHSAMAMIDACATMGRGGLGAVLGSKNLKALVVRGSGKVSVADPKRLEELRRGLFDRLKGYPLREAASELGMIGAWALYARQLLPQGASDSDIQVAIKRFGPEAYLRLKKKRVACPSCFLADKDELYLRPGEESVFSTSFLNAAIVGCAFLMRDAEEAVSALALLDDLGLDFMTLTSQSAFLLELRARGIIGDTEVEGIQLERGEEILRGLAVNITERRGKTGEAFARGWKGAIEHFGPDTRRYTILVRGQDCLYDPRVTGLGTMEFEQVTCPRGPTSASGGSATYLPGLTTERMRRLTQRMGAGEEALGRIFPPSGGLNVGRLTRYSEDWFSLFSSLGLCNRHQINRFYNAELIRDIMEAVTGVELSTAEMMEKAAAGWELYRENNTLEGLGLEEDRFPEAWFSEEPMWGRGGRLKDYMGDDLSREDVLALLQDYYDERGRRPG